MSNSSGNSEGKPLFLTCSFSSPIVPFKTVGKHKSGSGACPRLGLISYELE
jgi:hypothetical protein